MDLQPSASLASASSFPSPTQFQMNGDPLLSLQKFHDFCQGGSTSSTSTACPNFSFPNFSSSTKAGTGIDLTSELLSASTTWGPATANERIRSSAGPYFSPNKIAYRSHGAAGGPDSSPPALPSLPTSGSSTLQGILQRCGLSSSTTLDVRYSKNHQQDFYVRPSTSACITQKIRNLDEILRNLDHSSMSKRFAITDARDLAGPVSKKQQQWRDPDVVKDMISSELLRSSSDHGSGTLGGSVIPDGITHINKSISRMEFKAQMEKLTGCIDDRWPGNGRVEKVGNMYSKPVGSTPYTAETALVKSFQEHPQVKEDLPSQVAHGNVSNASAASANILEEMMRNITGLERRLAKRDRSKQTKQRGFFARGRLWVQRPAGKKMAAMLQKHFKRHAASINARLDKTDLAIIYLRRQREEAQVVSPSYEGNYNIHKEKKLRRVCRSSSNFHKGSLNDSKDISSTASEKNLAESRTPTVAEKCMEAYEVLSRSMQQIQNQLCALQRDNQNMGQSLETTQKQSNEQNMEIELCWTAINHLCIDNETFREELQSYQSGLQQDQQ